MILPAATVIGTNVVIDYGTAEAAHAALDAWVPSPVELRARVEALRLAGDPIDPLNSMERAWNGALDAVLATLNDPVPAAVGSEK